MSLGLKHPVEALRVGVPLILFTLLAEFHAVVLMKSPLPYWLLAMAHCHLLKPLIALATDLFFHLPKIQGKAYETQL